MLTAIRRTIVSFPWIIALALLACPVSPARGQGTQGMLAEPITTRQLVDYAERLGLSPSQMTAIEAAHDEYKASFRTLRDGEIAEFLATAAGMGGRMPDRERFREMIDTMEKLQAKIELLDDRLFARLVPVLTEDQVARLPRVRLLRERQRLMEVAQQAISMSGRALVDVSELVHDLDLEGAAIVDPTLEAYERQLNTGLEKVNKAAFRMYLDLIDGLAAAGMEDIDFMDPETDPEEMQRFQETMQQLWMDLQTKLRDQTLDIMKLDRSTFTSVAGMLSPREARRFRTEYYMNAYPATAFALPVGDTAWLVRAIDDGRVDEATREAMRPAVTDYLLKLDAIVAKVIELTDEQAAEMNPFDMNMDAMREHQEKLTALQEEVMRHRATLDALLLESVGEEALARTRKTVGAIATDAAPQDATMEIAEGETDEEMPAYHDPFVPSRIDRHELGTIADELEFDEGERAVLETLHNDYVTAYEGLAIIQDLDTAQGTLWTYDPEQQTSHPPEDEAIDRVYALRRRAIDAVRATDEAFFEQVKLLVPDDKRALVDRLRGRHERVTVPADGGWMTMQLDVAGTIDLTSIVAGVELSADEQRAIDPVLAAYETDALAAHHARIEAALALRQVGEKWSTTAQRLQEQGEEVDWRNYQRVIAAESSRAHEASERMAALNRETLEAMRSHLSTDHGQRLERAFTRAAYPDVFEDAACVEDHLTRALALDDLTSRQRSDLQELAASYRPEYERLSSRMVEFHSAMPDFTNWDPDQWQAYQERQNEMAKVEYDRNELSYRAAHGIRTVLDERQLERIGGLPAEDAGR